MDQLLAMLRAAGDPTRLRLLLILREAELTVSELTHILGQSQPRVSRHLRLLCEAGLLQRFKEGSWVFYRAVDRGARAQLGATLAMLASSEPDVMEADRRQLASVREARADAAAAYFKANASEWERIRSLHAPERDVEAAIVDLFRGAGVDALLDVGTGTGRMLELLEPLIRRGVGIDVSAEMLAVARDRLERGHVQHCQVRLGDLFRLPFPDGAARVLKPGGQIVVVDFAPHQLEFCRDELNHRRLGFSDEEAKGWFRAARLSQTETRSIAPGADAGAAKLTVRIWAAQSKPVKAPHRVGALT